MSDDHADGYGYCREYDEEFQAYMEDAKQNDVQLADAYKMWCDMVDYKITKDRGNPVDGSQGGKGPDAGNGSGGAADGKDKAGGDIEQNEDAEMLDGGGQADGGGNPDDLGDDDDDDDLGDLEKLEMRIDQDPTFGSDFDVERETAAFLRAHPTQEQQEATAAGEDEYDESLTSSNTTSFTPVNAPAKTPRQKTSKGTTNSTMPSATSPATDPDSKKKKEVKRAAQSAGKWKDDEALYNWEMYWDATGKPINRDTNPICDDRARVHNQWRAANGYHTGVRTWAGMEQHTNDLVARGVTLDSLKAKVRGSQQG